MTGLLARCEADGLVDRERSPRDGRALDVRLTERGRELRAASAAAADLVAAMGTANRDALVRALKGVIEL